MERRTEREAREKKEVVELLRKQLSLEVELVRLYKDRITDIKSSPVRRMLHMIQLDSMKHIEMCQTALEVLQGEDVLKPEKKELVEGLQQHIELESGAVDRANKILNNIWIRETGGLKELIEQLRNDEKKHHQVLKKVAEKAFFRLDWHDMAAIWRIGHGEDDWLEERYKRRREFENKRATE